MSVLRMTPCHDPGRPSWAGQRPLTLVTACQTANGTPAFALSEARVTQDEYENGVHFYLAEGELLERGFEEPFVHFDEFDMPAFLLPAVRQYLGLPATAPSPAPSTVEQP